MLWTSDSEHRFWWPCQFPNDASELFKLTADPPVASSYAKLYSDERDDYRALKSAAQNVLVADAFYSLITEEGAYDLRRLNQYIVFITCRFCRVDETIGGPDINGKTL